MKKKEISKSDLKDWQEFLENPKDIYDKEFSSTQNKSFKKRFKFDLHGFSLEEANKKTKNIIETCYQNNFKEVLIITGKGIHSKNDNVYSSQNLSKLRFSIPHYIDSTPDLRNKISKISMASPEDGGEGAILIKLKEL